MICDGCGLLVHDIVYSEEPDTKGFHYCAACIDRRANDPTIYVHGKHLVYSELEAQAEHDEHLVAALLGDSVQEQRR